MFKQQTRGNLPLRQMIIKYSFMCIVYKLLLLCLVGCPNCKGSSNILNSNLTDFRNSLKVFSDTMKAYNKKIRPNFGGAAVEVSIEIKVISFGPIDEASQEYYLDIFFRQWWRDPTFNNMFNDSFTLNIDPADLFWKPDTYFRESRNPKFHSVTNQNMRVVISTDGTIYYSSRISLNGHCPMNFRKYPFDVQYCTLTIESYSYTVEDVYYRWKSYSGWYKKAYNGIEWKASELAAFKLMAVDTGTKGNTNSKGSFSQLKVSFRLARRKGFYVWYIYMPCALLVMMTWANFWIPAAAVPARVTLSVTSILSTLFVMINSSRQLAKISYLKALDVFIMGSVAFIVFTLMEFVLVMNIKPRKKKPKHDKSQETSNNCNHQDEESYKADIPLMEFTSNKGSAGPGNIPKICNKKMLWNRDKAAEEGGTVTKANYMTLRTRLSRYTIMPYHPIDKIACILFPVCYALFVLVYCVRYEVI